MKKRLTASQRSALEKRFTELKKLAFSDTPGAASRIVDAVSPDDSDIAKVVEKIMSLMEATDGFGKYHITAANKANFVSLFKKAFEEIEESRETPMEEAKDLDNPILHPIEDTEHELQTMDDEHLMGEVEKLEHDVKQEIPSLSSEHKLAILLNAPKNVRLAKAERLRALANTLESTEKDVSGNNVIEDSENSNSLLDNYEGQEAGSMKDVKKDAAIKDAARLLLAAIEEDEKEEKDEKEDELDKEAVLKLALQYLTASDENPFDEKEEKNADEKEEKDEEPVHEEASLEDKKAILHARLAILRKKANVDGKSMTTPKEVPSPTGTSEDQAKGDAKIQYSTATGEAGLEEIHPRRQKIPTDKSVAGTDEPNAIYQSNKPSSPDAQLTSETDSSKDVNNKRVLPDMGTAVQKAEPSSPTNEMESGAGSHQKTKDWEKAKNESDVTPSGDRLVGLAAVNDLVATRTDRAMKLATLMAQRNFITTQAQLTEQVIKLASMDDDAFGKIAEFFEGMPETEEKPKERSHTFPPKDEKEERETEDEQEKDEPVQHEAADTPKKVRRIEDYGIESGSITKKAGLNKPLLLGSADVPSTRTAISNKLKGLFTDAVSQAENALHKEAFFEGDMASLERLRQV